MRDTTQRVVEAGSDNLQTFGGLYEGGVHLQQAPSEFAGFLNEMLDWGGLEGQNYLEIGAAAGGSARLVWDVLKPAKMVLIDNNTHPKFGVRAAVLKGCNYEELIGDSTSEHIAEDLARLSMKFAVIFIDGDHSERVCASDLALAKKHRAAGGVIALHDILQDGPSAVLARENSRSVTMIVNDRSLRLGIGVIW